MAKKMKKGKQSRGVKDDNRPLIDSYSQIRDPVFLPEC